MDNKIAIVADSIRMEDTISMIEVSADIGYAIRVNGKESVAIREYNGMAKIIRIPERFNSLPVKVIGKRAFKEKGIEQLVLPEGITDFDEECFSKNHIRELVIPSAVTLGTGAFYKNPIEWLRLPAGLVSIGDFCFWGCQLEQVQFPDSLKRIGVWAFGETPIKEVVIGADVAFGSSDSISGIPGFSEWYAQNGKKAGRYVFKNGRWVYKK